MPFYTALVSAQLISKAGHYCTCFSNTCVHFFVLFAITRDFDFKILKRSRLLESYSIFCKEHWKGCLEKHIISVLAVLIFISASKHASKNQSSSYSRSLIFKLNNARSSTNSRRLPKYDDTTAGTVSVYLVHVYNKQKRKKKSLVLVQHRHKKILF